MTDIRWAVVKNGIVDNVVHWDGDPLRWLPPDDVIMVELTEDEKFVGIGDTFDGEDFSKPERSFDSVKAAAAEAINAEARSRIIAIANEDKQRNLIARALVISTEYGPRPWPAEIEEEWAAGKAIWAQIEPIRIASNLAIATVMAAETVEEVDSLEVEWP